MQRRSFLKSAAALAPAASLRAFAESDKPASPDHGHIIPCGHDRLGESHPLGFSHLTFKVLPRETSNGLFIAEHQNLLKGGPPLHLHYEQEEWFYVLEGEVDFQVGEKRFRLGPGDSAFGPRLIPHTFSHVGTTPGRMLICFTPAGKMEHFFRAVAVPNSPGMTPELFAQCGMKYLGPSPFA